MYLYAAYSRVDGIALAMASPSKNSIVVEVQHLMVECLKYGGFAEPRLIVKVAARIEVCQRTAIRIHSEDAAPIAIARLPDYRRLRAQIGIYLVGWFDGDKWDDEHGRLARVPKMSPGEAKTRLDQQAGTLPDGFFVRPVTVECYVPKTSK
jgi:hypothetical protein